MSRTSVRPDAIPFAGSFGRARLDEISGLSCFLAGTRIQTSDGQRAVETLTRGALVRTALGLLRRVTWIGHRVVDIAGHPDPRDVRPVRIAARSLDDALPLRDLYLSPDHGVLIEGLLVPVRQLIDGDAIEQDASRAFAHYVHVSLSTHDLVLAEGLPVETYLGAGRGDPLDDPVGPREARTPIAERPARRPVLAFAVAGSARDRDRRSA